MIFFVGGTSWTLDCCKVRLSYTIFMNEQRQSVIFFKLFVQISWNNYWKWHWTIILSTDLDPLYLLNETGLDWHPNSPFWIQNIPNVATNSIGIWFLTHNALSDKGKLDLIVLLITEQITQERHQNFLKLSPFSFQRGNI